MTELSRRQALRAGAVVGATAWVAPAIAALSVSPAAADAASFTAPKPPSKPGTINEPNTPTTSDGGKTSSIITTNKTSSATTQKTATTTQASGGPATQGGPLAQTGADTHAAIGVASALLAGGTAALITAKKVAPDD